MKKLSSKPMILFIARFIVLLIDILSYMLEYQYEKNNNAAVRAKGRLIDTADKIGSFIGIIECMR